jgi:VanZ family protein
MPKRLLGPLCVFVVCGILTLGLWPFHSPANDVKWSEGAHGLSLQGEGSLFSTSSLAVRGSEYSVEIWASTDTIRGGETLLTFHPDKGDCAVVSLLHSLEDLKIQTRQEKSFFHITKDSLFVNDVFRKREPVFLTITSGVGGTSVYANGRLLRAVQNFRIPECGVPERLILGDSSRQSNGWVGTVRGLATYQHELSEDQVRRHYETWTMEGRPTLEQSDRNELLYLFDEGRGRVAHDQSAAALNLEMPERYTVVDKETLAGFWGAFKETPGYWEDILNNIVGFVPVGFCFFAYMANATSTRRPALLAMFLGIALSLTIECMQPFLSTRESDTTDLLTNAFGTLLGVLLYLRMSRWWQQHFGRSMFY